MFGYYGKLPSQGDFLKRRADVGFVRVWDDWLQRSFAFSREALGERWHASYETAPLWRFCFGSDVCGPDPMIGVMMPSQDRVGRCFPLTLFYRLRHAVGAGALDTAPLMTAMEDAALRTLEEGQDRSSLDAELEQMARPDLPAGGSGGQSHWLSTYFRGQARRDSRSFSGLPPPDRFCELLNPDIRVPHV